MRVIIKYTGNLAKKAETLETELDVQDVRIALNSVKKEIEGRIGKAMLYSVLLNGRALQTYKKPEDELSEGSVFTVVPVILGG